MQSSSYIKWETIVTRAHIWIDFSIPHSSTGSPWPISDDMHICILYILVTDRFRAVHQLIILPFAGIQIHLSFHSQSSLTWTLHLTASLSLSHLWFQRFYTFLSSILNLDCINIMLIQITEWNPPIPMFMIVLTTTLSDFIAIFKHLMHLLEKHNLISMHPANVREIHNVWSKGLATPCVQHYPCHVKLLHTISKHWKHLAAIKCCIVLMKEHISDIILSISKICKNMFLILLKSFIHVDGLHL